MHRRQDQSSVWIGALVALVPVGLPPVLANIDLEFRPSSQTVAVSQVVDVGLYAVSDSSSNQTFSAIDLVFGWDPAYLDLLGVDDTGNDPAVMSSFFPVGDPWGLNETTPPQDGDGLYSAFAQLGVPVDATPAGTLDTAEVTIVPEPSAVVLVLAAAGMVLARRRR